MQVLSSIGKLAASCSTIGCLAQLPAGHILGATLHPPSAYCKPKVYRRLAMSAAVQKIAEGQEQMEYISAAEHPWDSGSGEGR